MTPLRKCSQVTWKSKSSSERPTRRDTIRPHHPLHLQGGPPKEVSLLQMFLITPSWGSSPMEHLWVTLKSHLSSLIGHLRLLKNLKKNRYWKRCWSLTLSCWMFIFRNLLMLLKANKSSRLMSSLSRLSCSLMPSRPSKMGKCTKSYPRTKKVSSNHWIRKKNIPLPRECLVKLQIKETSRIEEMMPQLLFWSISSPKRCSLTKKYQLSPTSRTLPLGYCTSKSRCKTSSKIC